MNILPNYNYTIMLIEKNQIMINHWEKYRKSYTYALPYSFSQVCKSLLEIMEIIN